MDFCRSIVNLSRCLYVCAVSCLHPSTYNSPPFALLWFMPKFMALPRPVPPGLSFKIESQPCEVIFSCLWILLSSSQNIFGPNRILNRLWHWQQLSQDSNGQYPTRRYAQPSLELETDEERGAVGSGMPKNVNTFNWINYLRACTTQGKYISLKIDIYRNENY